MVAHGMATRAPRCTARSHTHYGLSQHCLTRSACWCRQPLCARASASPAPSGDFEGKQPGPSQPASQGLWDRVKQFFGGGDKALLREKLAKYGLGAFAAYGIVSNMNAGVIMTISWLTVVRQTGLTPLDGGQWKTFLAVYAGLYIGSNFLRPLRLSLALAASPLVNLLIEGVERTTCTPKPVAFGIVLAMIAAGSFTLIFGTIALCGGFPNGLPESVAALLPGRGAGRP